MRLGFLTDAADGPDVAARLGFTAVELDVHAFGDPRRGPLDAAALERVARRCAELGVAVTAVAYYRLADDPPADADVPVVYEHAFAAARALGAPVVASMSGFDARLDWARNLDRFARLFGPLAARAEELGLLLALENWMGFGGRLPFRPINMGGAPATWDEWFERVPCPALGLEFDPSHLAWQGIDPYRALREYGSRVHHFHAKDVELDAEARYRHGVNGDTFRFRIPGYGELDWPRLLSSLLEVGYDGGVIIEHEDDVFGGARFEEGLVRGRQVLAPLVEPR